MSTVCDRFVVVLDANVLYPFYVRDALLRFAEAGLFRARWSDLILDEWRRALLRMKPSMEQSIEAQIAAMNGAFPESKITGFEKLIEQIELPDPDDRHVVAAAIRAGAEHIVTENLRDFPPGSISHYGIEAVSADDFLSSTFELYMPQALSALHMMRKAYRRPPLNPADFIMALQSRGLPKLAAYLRENIDTL